MANEKSNGTVTNIQELPRFGNSSARLRLFCSKPDGTPTNRSATLQDIVVMLEALTSEQRDFVFSSFGLGQPSQQVRRQRKPRALSKCGTDEDSKAISDWMQRKLLVGDGT